MSDPAKKSQGDVTEIEQAILACVITNKATAFDAAMSEGLRAEHFLIEQHAELWADICEIVSQGAAPASFALFQRVGTRRGKDAKAYLGKLKAALIFTSPRDAPWLARSVIEACMRVGASSRVSAGAAALSAIETIERTQRGEIKRIKSGFADIDKRLGGFNPGRLYILGGRPSMGKTALALWMAWNVARVGIPVMIFSLEMTADELSMRWIAGLTGIELETMNAGTVDHNDVSRMVASQVDIDALPITIEDRPGLSLQEIHGLARQFIRGKPRALVIIDHLGLVATPGREDASRVERTADVSNGLKALAKRLNQPVLALAQLNRANEQRDDKRPQLSDLRWAGELEQDADCIAFVHRDAYYLERAKPKRTGGMTAEKHATALGDWTDSMRDARGTAEIIIAKNRNGSVGPVEVAFDEKTARFSDLARDYER